VLKSVSSVSTCESHWSGAARLPLLRERIGLQATSDVDPAECPFRVDIVAEVFLHQIANFRTLRAAI
jgi:hypothetical protein